MTAGLPVVGSLSLPCPSSGRRLECLGCTLIGCLRLGLAPCWTLLGVQHARRLSPSGVLTLRSRTPNPTYCIIRGSLWWMCEWLSQLSYCEDQCRCYHKQGDPQIVQRVVPRNEVQGQWKVFWRHRRCAPDGCAVVCAVVYCIDSAKDDNYHSDHGQHQC